MLIQTRQHEILSKSVQYFYMKYVGKRDGKLLHINALTKCTFFYPENLGKVLNRYNISRA
jgi:hypothetical protein